MLLLAGFTWTACSDDEDEGESRVQLTGTDKMFVEHVAMSNMTEIELGQLASTRATDSSVRAYAEMMVMDHNTAQNELEAIVDDYDGINWPNELNEQNKEMRDQLMNMSGYSFDSMYMASQVMSHRTTDSVFQLQMNNGQEPRIKTYATKYHPTIEQHLDAADSIHAMLMPEMPGDDNQAGGDDDNG